MSKADAALTERLRIMVLTAPQRERALVAVVEECLSAGATAVQLRDKAATGRELYEQATVLGPVVRQHDALFLINDRLDVALAAEADGVHLGPDDLPVNDARRLVPSGFVIGYSTDDPGEARRAAASGADYLGVGAVYGTTSKAGLAGEAIGPDRVRAVREASGLPVVGIGGITVANAGEVARTGAGIAVLSAAMGAARPGHEVGRLLKAVSA